MTDPHTLQHCRQTLEAAGYSVKSPEPNPEVVTWEDYQGAGFLGYRETWESKGWPGGEAPKERHIALRNRALARWIRERTNAEGWVRFAGIERPEILATYSVPAEALLRFFAVPPEET